MRKTTTMAIVALALIAGGANAATFKATLSPLNAGVDGSFLDVSGFAEVTRNGKDTLTVSIEAKGLAPNQRHAQHIHGVTGGDSRTPTLADDARGDGDGVIELLDGVPAYGPVILPLFDTDGMFPLVGDDGVLSFSRTYDLTTAMFNTGFAAGDLFPLAFREIVLHGGVLGAVGFDAGRAVEEADGTAGYKGFLPVAAGELAPVPLPAAGWLLLAGVGGLAGLGRRRQA